MSLIDSLKWRSAVKKFDTNKKVSNNDLEALIEAGNLAATSGGLQPFKMVVVSNDDLQSQLVQHSYNQEQVKDASHVLVFAVETNTGASTVDAYVKRANEVRGLEASDLIAYSDMMKGFVTSMDENSRMAWIRSQAYIALGTVMSAAADLKIDTCPMEGFDAMKYQELLGLEDKNLMPVVILPIGYRSEDDMNSKAPKVRKSRENFVVEIY